MNTDCNHSYERLTSINAQTEHSASSLGATEEMSTTDTTQLTRK
jgi:hypothetical protein